MKKRLAKWFLLVAKRLDPETHVENTQHIEDYDAQKVGLTYEVTKKYIKEYRLNHGKKLSVRTGRSMLFKEVWKKIHDNIIECIDKNNLIEYDVREHDGRFYVSGELKVYVRKPEDNGEG